MILDKQEFNKLDIHEQLKYINNILLKGECLRNISSRFIDQCYIFNKEAIQYIKDIEYKENINILNKVKSNTI